MPKEKKPILAIKCAKCSAIYSAYALAYPITEDWGQDLADAINRGDEPFIVYDGIILQECKCER